MKIFSFILMTATLTLFTGNAEAFLCGKKCKAKKAVAAKHIRSGGNCTDLKGRAKRKCKSQARKIGKKIAKNRCAGKGANCRRTVKRDQKAKHGSYGFIGAKKANAQGKANWEQFRGRKADLRQQLNSGQITHQQFKELSNVARKGRVSESYRIGTTKSFKTIATIGAIASGGLVGVGAAVGASALQKGAHKRKFQKSNIAYKKKLAIANGSFQKGGQQFNTGQAYGNQQGYGAAPSYGSRAVAHAAQGGSCQQHPKGSCEIKKCKCANGVRRANKGKQIKHHTNRNGKPTVQAICAQNAHFGLIGAWDALIQQKQHLRRKCRF
jgi:hypothetical protein